MTEPFEDRLLEATVEPQGIDFSAFRAAAAKASTQLNRERALTIIRIAHRQPVDQSSIVDFVRRINVDEVLVEESGQGQLVSLLAVESLLALLARNVQSIGVLTAAAVRCAAHSGWKAAHPDLLDTSRFFLEQRSVSARDRHTLSGSLTKEKPKFEPGTAQHAEEELQAARDVLKSDRARFWERDQLMWWLLSQTRPQTAFGIAQSFNYAISFIPEPLQTDEMLKAKLDRAPSNVAVPSVENLPADIAELCPYLGALIQGEHEDPVIPKNAPDDERPDAVQAIRNYLNELILIRAFRAVTG
jgi:hypothetical protein